MDESAAADGPRLKVGYALEPKKIASFIKPSLVDHAARRGIDLVAVDPGKPLLSQGPFDCVIHKLHGEDWKNQLIQFASAYPTVPIVDHPDAIERLHSRITMLQLVPQLDLRNVDVPKQIVVKDSHSFQSLKDLLQFPVIAKPVIADGSADSHDMLLIFNQQGLLKLEPPVVLQEFVNHGGVIFKIYVVGQHVECVTRRSLPDISEEKMKTLGDSLSFSQISNLTAIHHTSNDAFLETTDLGRALMPPMDFVTDLALRLRRSLCLNLFNFDLIRDGDRYLVIDINYFPGYAKMPNYETVLSEFFWKIVHNDPSVVLQKPSPCGR